MSLVAVARRVMTGQRDITTLEEYAHALAGYDFAQALYAVNGGLTQTIGGEVTPELGRGFAQIAQMAVKDNGIVFACLAVRQAVFSTARFRWQRLRDGKPSDTFGSKTLNVLERPWVGGTTQDLLSRMIQDADLAGNAFLIRIGNEIVRLRPDWVYVVVGWRQFRGGKLGWSKLGYVYYEGGRWSGEEPVPLAPEEVCHFMPMPDPEHPFRGMSWITPVAREVTADKAMTRHRQKFFDNGATPNMIIKHAAGASEAKVRRWIEEMAANNAGIDNAYRDLNLYPGADATVVGKDFRQVDFKTVQGAGETRICAAANVPPIIVGASEGLESATYSNYAQARRRFADGTMHPLWQNGSGSMEPLVTREALPVGGIDTRLWYDVSQVPFLREDAKDAAAIAQVRATTIRTYTDAGFTPESAVKAVLAEDERLLEHSGLYSVQLRPPGETAPAPGEAPEEEAGGEGEETPPPTANGQASGGGRELPTRGNKYHDPATGKFASGPGGAAGAEAGLSGADRAFNAAMAEAGWQTEDTDKFRSEWESRANAIGLETAKPNEWGTGLPAAEVIVPPGTRVYRMGENRIFMHPDAEMEPGDLARLGTNVQRLSADFPLRGPTTIGVEPRVDFEDGCLGATVRGTGFMRLNEVAVTGEFHLSRGFSTVGDSYLDKRDYTITHEWGHGLDHMSQTTAVTRWDAALKAGTSHYGEQTEREGFAESFADLINNPAPGHHVLPATDMYAAAEGWTVPGVPYGDRT